VNENHIYEGTQKENIHDAMERHPTFLKGSIERGSSPEHLECLKKVCHQGVEARMLKRVERLLDVWATNPVGDFEVSPRLWEQMKHLPGERLGSLLARYGMHIDRK
jgi:hypothetical protein